MIEVFVGLAAQQHDIEFVLDGVGLHDRGIVQGDVAIGAFDHKTCGGELAGAARPHQKCDVAAGLQHPAAEIPADGASTDYENAHW